MTVAAVWRALLMTLCVLAAGAAMARGSLEGQVVRVSDGDTLWVQPAGGGRALKVRMLGIDAPEMCQPGGPQARDALAARVLNRTVRLEGERLDDHDRRLARVWLGGQDVGAALVEQGLAWSYRFRSDPGPYVAEETRARRAGLGVFAQPGAMSPRDFRRQNGPCR
jgi:micrococcal nuclease